MQMSMNYSLHIHFLYLKFYDVAIKTFRFVNTHLTASNKNESANQNAVIIIALEIGLTGHKLNFCLDRIYCLKHTNVDK